MTERSSSGSHSKPAKRTSKTPVVFPTFDEIAWRTHEIFTSEAGRSLTIFECWRRAEDELLERAAARSVR